MANYPHRSGSSRKGIPRGTCRIAVELWRGDSEKDRWNGDFGQATSPIIRTIAGKGDIGEIDLDHLDKK